MAPGDKMFYLISYQDKTNKLTSYKSRELANDAYSKIGKEVPVVMVSGETGDIL